MTNTKERHLEILEAAESVLKNHRGITYIDGLDQEEKLPLLRHMAKEIISVTGCHINSAKSNLAKAMKRARYKKMQEKEAKDNWGGERPNQTGRPRKDKNAKT